MCTSEIDGLASRFSARHAETRLSTSCAAFPAGRVVQRTRWSSVQWTQVRAVLIGIQQERRTSQEHCHCFAVPAPSRHARRLIVTRALASHARLAPPCLRWHRRSSTRSARTATSQLACSAARLSYSMWADIGSISCRKLNGPVQRAGLLRHGGRCAASVVESVMRTRRASRNP
jgi:hypothetical protein